MSKDRQEKKLRKSGKVQPDRDKSLHYGGATRLMSTEESKELSGDRR